MQRAPKEPLDYGAVLINFWRQLAQAWRHRGPFCDMAFESKIAFFSFIISGEMNENWSSFITFLTFYSKIFTCTHFVASTLVFLKRHGGAIIAPIGAKS